MVEEAMRVIQLEPYVIHAMGLAQINEAYHFGCFNLRFAKDRK